MSVKKQMPPKADESKRLYTQYFDLAKSEDACDATEGVSNNQMKFDIVQVWCLQNYT